MEIKTIHYSALLNLGDYNNERIGFTVQVEADESPDEIVDKLREKVKQIGGENADKLYRKISDNRAKLYTLNRQIEEATQKWNQTAEFLRAQGIKVDASNVPQFTNLLTQFEEEQINVFEGEMEDQLEDEESSF